MEIKIGMTKILDCCPIPMVSPPTAGLIWKLEWLTLRENCPIPKMSPLTADLLWVVWKLETVIELFGAGELASVATSRF